MADVEISGAPGGVAVLVSAHGSPDSLDDLPAFLANIRRGHPAPPDVLAEVRRRYALIGGRSPLGDVTAAQARALGERLGLPVAVAMRLWRPYPADALRGLWDAGYRRVVSVPVAPYSVHVYHDAVAAAARALPGALELVRVAPWNLEPALIRGFVRGITAALAAVPAGRRVRLLLSAHSLPLRVLAAGDPYASLVEATAAAVLAALGGGVEHQVVFQSQGMTADPWLGPDLLAAIGQAADAGVGHVLVAPIGFLADHIEVLYDLDIEARDAAAARGVGFSRTASLNAAPELIEAMAAAVRAALGASPAG